MQDTFASVHERLADRDPDEPLLPWVLGVARSHASSYRKSRSLEPSCLADSLVDPELASAAPGPEVELLHGEQRRAVDARVGRLPRKAREVFLLRELEGWTVPEIATLLKVKPSTVAYRHLEARWRLAAAFAHRAVGKTRARRGAPRRDTTS